VGALASLLGGAGGFSVSPSSGADAGTDTGDFFNNAGLIVGDGNSQGGLTAVPTSAIGATGGSGLNIQTVALYGGLLLLGLVALKTLARK